LDHKHLVVRAEVSSAPGENETSEICSWLKALISSIEMRIMHGPTAMYCNVPGNRGMTAFAIIETSHIVMHSWDEQSPHVIQLDVYSCSEFEPRIIFEALKRFEPFRFDAKFLDRTTGLVEIPDTWNFAEAACMPDVRVEAGAV
jgi:S-adenosylmethionine/arginine decarboxylase-like enzyme